MNEQIQKLMKTLNISEDEARQVIEDDRRIDKGEKLFELSAELEAGAKKARQADRKKSDTPVKRERKSDNDKTMSPMRKGKSNCGTMTASSKSCCLPLEVEGQIFFVYFDEKIFLDKCVLVWYNVGPTRIV